MLGALGFSAVIFVAFAVLLISSKPKFLLDNETGNWKQFGFGQGCSCLTITSVIIVLAIVTYLCVACIAAGWKKTQAQFGGFQDTTIPAFSFPL